MPLKTITVNGRTFKLGRVPVSRPAPDFSLRKPAAVPAPPATMPAPGYDAAELAQMFLNDSLGDCVIADAYHYLGGITAGAGKPFIATNTQVTTDYSNACGYPPDEGCDIPTVLAYYQSTGFADGSKLLGSWNVDPTNQLAVQQNIWVAGGVCFGVNLPDAWINPTPQASGFVWDVAGSPDPMNGHCFEGFGYSAQGVLIATWGMWGTITWAAIAKYAAAANGGELHARINPEMVNATTGLAPNGMTLTQICTYANALGGSIVVPPGPTPTPTPTPTATAVSVPFGVYTIGVDSTGANLVFTPYAPPAPAPTVSQTVTFPSPVSSIEITTLSKRA